MTKKPRLAVWKFSSCDGCQLSLLDCEDEVLAVANAIEIAYFPEATRRDDDGGIYDISFVEGSVTTPHEAETIKDIRARSTTLITLGACATAGGIQALKNGADTSAFIDAVYAHPEFIDTLETATPISDHVTVDFELRGCPISKKDLIELIAATLAGRAPQVPEYATCVECKLAGHVCVMVAQGQPCLGPVTHAGCGALCPGYARGCYGCFGPKETPNTAALAAQLAANGADGRAIKRLFSTYNTNAPAFREEAKAHEG